MALNKKQASLATRIFIGLVAVVLVISFLPALFGGFGGGGDSREQPSGQLETIAAKYTQRVAYNEQLLASEPTSYTVLLDQAYAYHDWAIDVRDAGIQGADLPMLTSARVYYERALDINDGDPSVKTDYAIVTFYSGDQAAAIRTVEEVMKSDPGFSLAYFNAGIFYRATGQNDKALTVLRKFVELDPQNQSAPTAQQWIQELQAGGGTSGAPATSTPTP